MLPILALTICVVLIFVLLYIERMRNPEGSVALWVPTFWMLLCGSKPIGRWLAINNWSLETSPEVGSPYDRLVLTILIILGVFVIYRRKIEWSMILKANFWLILLLLYLGISILWSDFAFVSFKRWFRLVGAFPMAMVILSERSPLKSMESVLRRCAYVLIPLSIVLIKYFPAYGVQYTYWEGTKMWVGVSSQKNSFGVVCSISAFLIFWTFLREWRTRSFLKSKSQTFAEGLVFGLSVYLLLGFRGVYPATAIGILISGIAALIILFNMKKNQRKVARFSVLMVVVGLLLLNYSQSFVSLATSSFNRDASFTGRDEIWRLVLEEASKKPLLGYGYGAYWGLQDEKIYSKVLVRESHSGYLDVYLQGGIVGIVLLFAFLFAYCRKALNKFIDSPDWGLFGICMLIMTLIHNYTESDFIQTTSYFWNLTVFLTIVFTKPCWYKYKYIVVGSKK